MTLTFTFSDLCSFTYDTITALYTNSLTHTQLISQINTPVSEHRHLVLTESPSSVHVPAHHSMSHHMEDVTPKGLQLLNTCISQQFFLKEWLLLSGKLFSNSNKRPAAYSAFEYCGFTCICCEYIIWKQKIIIIIQKEQKIPQNQFCASEVCKTTGFVYLQRAELP